jgi:hypothetical protein
VALSDAFLHETVQKAERFVALQPLVNFFGAPALAAQLTEAVKHASLGIAAGARARPTRGLRTAARSDSHLQAALARVRRRRPLARLDSHAVHEYLVGDDSVRPRPAITPMTQPVTASETKNQV